MTRAAFLLAILLGAAPAHADDLDRAYEACLSRNEPVAPIAWDTDCKLIDQALREHRSHEAQEALDRDNTLIRRVAEEIRRGKR